MIIAALVLLLALPARAVTSSVTDTASQDVNSRVAALELATRNLNSGKPNITGKPTFASGICFGDGTCQNSGTGSLPVGAFIIMGSSYAPSGTVECNGASYSTTTYPSLYSVINCNWGCTLSAGATTNFNVPDLRGVFMRGWTHGASTNTYIGDQDTVARSTIAVGGNSGDKVGSYQDDQFRSHTHTAIFTAGSGGANGAGSDGENGQSGATGGHETRPKNASVLYAIVTNSVLGSGGNSVSSPATINIAYSSSTSDESYTDTVDGIAILGSTKSFTVNSASSLVSVFVAVTEGGSGAGQTQHHSIYVDGVKHTTKVSDFELTSAASGYIGTVSDTIILTGLSTGAHSLYVSRFTSSGTPSISHSQSPMSIIIQEIPQ